MSLDREQLSDVKNIVPLKVAIIAAFFVFGIKFLSSANVKNLIPFPMHVKNMVPFPTTVSNAE